MARPKPAPSGRARLLVGLLSGLVVVALVLAAWPDPTDELLVLESGGGGTTASADLNAFGDSARNLTNEQRRRFEVGDSFFTQNWVTAPSSTGARDGLGPLLNAQSCSSCHLRDGRGTPDGLEPGLLMRLSVPGEGDGDPDPRYGDQIQDRAILGVPAEATVRIVYVEEIGTYADGTGYTLRRPLYDLDDLAYGPLSVDVMISPRLAPAVFGVGLLEAIPEEEIVAAADTDDIDGDGISGRPNYIEGELGRFGWKASVPTVAQQAASAFSGDIGITSEVRPDEICTAVQIECNDAPVGGTPEIPPDLFADVVFYNETLAVPARRNLSDPDVREGASLFAEIGCDSCHRPRYVTGADEIEALAGQVIFPFTDLLLHDMGSDLADDRPDGEATGSEWRTPPLWGLGLHDVVNDHEFYLHDGRARSVEEAILWHGGEARAARDSFVAMDTDQRSQLLEFLDSL